MWQHLAAILTEVSAAVVATTRRLRKLQQQRQPLLPCSLREVQHLRRQLAGEGSSRGRSSMQERWKQLRALNTAALEARQELLKALVDYVRCCTLIEVSGRVG